ncbi:uncharacterized protein BX664DRAFT_388415 [Halteromyces radiatus]|uniref:uncharacterized protein n=1 Tax=Halteromyces radiatus TaxID=101107 RepID=UPI00221E5F70|nr:uncharacterized protein BX664DRAFT_388415 [Halteromyces radiatus]KAI8081429.1 hypothetical protein BX664DRAFT_388415 [Halteromyces radiatus]
MVVVVTKSKLSLSTYQDNHHQHLLHLFSPTCLTGDLHYVDKTYYDSDNDHVLLTQTSSRKSLDVSQQSLNSALFNRAISLLASMSRLDLKNHNLHLLPNQINQFSHLTSLDLSHNHLTTLPTTLNQLIHLRHLNLAYNHFTHVPSALFHLGKLTTLNISHNTLLNNISSLLSNAVRLTTLDVSYTDIESLPAELACLLTIRIDHCPRLISHNSNFLHVLHHDPPSLLELCSRQLMTQPTYHTALTIYLQRQTQQHEQHNTFVLTSNGNTIFANWKSIIKRKFNRTTLPLTTKRQILHSSSTSTSSSSSSSSISPTTIRSFNKDISAILNLPSHLWDYMMRAHPCSFCGKPYVQDYVTRYRIIQRLDETLLPVHYHLCCAHWSNESDRLLSLFSSVVSSSL